MKRQLVLHKAWGCSDCTWTFQPAEPLQGKSLLEMEDGFRRELRIAFAAHDCKLFTKTQTESQ